MMNDTLVVELRQKTGKGASRRARRDGKLPGVVYGQDAHLNIALNPATVHKFLMMEGGKNKVFTLSGAGLEGKRAMIKQWQTDPVTRKLIHVDLLEILATEKIDVKVRLNFVGKPLGVTETGGVMSIIEREVEVSCLPDQIPHHIDVDVTALKIGDSIHLNEIAFPEGITKISQTNPTLVTVVPPTKEEDLAPKLEEAAEPEVLTAKKEEGAEGEEAAADEEGKPAGKEAKAAGKEAKAGGKEAKPAKEEKKEEKKEKDKK